MADQTKPTAQDYARDLHADLAIAEAATPGPWLTGFYPYESTVISTAGDGICEIAEMPERDDRPEDFAAIASNRQAAPAAMRRAIEAEGEILAWSERHTWQRFDESLHALADRIRIARKGAEKP